MDKTQEALKMAIEAMSCISQSRGDPLFKAIRACKEALEQKEQADIQRMGIAGAVEQLYLQSLEQPSWQGLSDDEIEKMYSGETGFLMNEGHGSDIALLDFARAIEAKLKEKNYART